MVLWYSTKARAGLLLLPALLVLVLVAACGGDEESGAGGSPAGGRTGSAEDGERLFGENCAACHGAAGDGTTVGPPLVHAIYNPNHHPDFAFHNAVNNGVPQHHWAFGDMEPRPGLSGGDVNDIICYVRQLQVDEGIYEGERRVAELAVAAGRAIWLADYPGRRSVRSDSGT